MYEKEPLFKDFYRNIPLSESNFYDSHNLTRIKQRFNNMVQNKTGRDMITARYDPYTPSGVGILAITLMLDYYCLFFRGLVEFLSPKVRS